MPRFLLRQSENRPDRYWRPLAAGAAGASSCAPVPRSGSLAPVRHAIVSSWALLFGITTLMVGDGLQGTLLAFRATLEGFPTAVTGLVMSTFYLGFLGGSLYTPRIVQQVGHVRVFAALATMASACVLLHAVFLGAVHWSLLRLLSGFCFAGLYVVTESWLNDVATNETRGKLLSVYMVLSYLGVAGGQLLLNVADPAGVGLFILVSVLISLAAVPLLLSVRSAPHHGVPEPVSLAALYRRSPLGVVSAFGIGVVSGALFGMAPVYGQNIGLSVGALSLLMSAPVVGCVLLQWPIGHLSDRFDRRTVLLASTLAAAALALACALLPGGGRVELLIGLFALFGGVSLPLYALAIAHTNDHLEREQMVAASGALVLASGIGSVLGPLGAAGLMSLLGPPGLFWTMAGVHLAVGLFALWRMAVRRARPLAEQGSYYLPVGTRGFGGAMDWLRRTPRQK